MRPQLTPEIKHLVDAGESPTEVSQRLGRRLDSIARALHRAGQTAQARAFWAEAVRERRRDHR